MEFESLKHTRTPPSVNFSMWAFFRHSYVISTAVHIRICISLWCGIILSLLFLLLSLSFSDVKVEVTALPSYEEKEEQFKNQVVPLSCTISAVLSARFFSFCESNGYLSRVSFTSLGFVCYSFRLPNLGSSFSTLSLQEAWLVIGGVLFLPLVFLTVHSKYGRLSKKTRTSTCLLTRWSMLGNEHWADSLFFQWYNDQITCLL